MLLRDHPDEVFAPWAICGFDNTTKRRLRIPEAILKQGERIRIDTITHLTGENRSFLEPFFSNREYSLFTDLFLYPISYEQSILGLLLVATGEDENSKILHNDLLSFLSLQDTVKELLWDCRESKLQKLDLSSLSESISNAETVVNDLLKQTAAVGSNLFICRIDSDQAVTELPVTKYSERFRLCQDVEKILHSLVAETGKFLKTDDYGTLLAFRSKSVKDSNLLLHHLNTITQDFLHIPGNRLFSDCRLIENEETTALELLAST